MDPIQYSHNTKIQIEFFMVEIMSVRVVQYTEPVPTVGYNTIHMRSEHPSQSYHEICLE